MKKIRKLLALLLTVVMCVGMLSMNSFAAETEESSTLNYLAIGDSITTGYGLTDADTEGYVPLFAEVVGATEMTNMAVGGQTAVGLLSAINNSSSYQEAIQEADVITITIGGNDMLGEFFELVAEICSEKAGYTITASQVKSALSYPAGNYSTISLVYTTLTETDYSSVLYDPDSDEPTEFEEAISTCVANINSITAKIKDLNPDVTIMVANQYDAYYWFTGCDNFVSLFETGTQMYNTALAENKSDDYTIADVYSAFAESETSLMNAQLDTVNFTVVNFDFHPNAAGHKKIAETFASVYESLKSSADTTAPTIIGIENGGIYCGEAAVTVTDTDLDTVTVDGEVQTLNENGSFTITSAGSHIIAASDKAGNESSVEITIYLNHTWNTTPIWKWNGYSSATATFTCSNNQEHTMDVIADEESVTYTVTKEATCTEAGTGQYTAMVCVDGVVYTNSVEVDIQASGHNYGTEWQSDENAHWRVCSNCDAITDYQQHEFGEWVITAEPTVDAAGTRVRTCSVCGYEESENVEKISVYTLSFETNGGDAMDSVEFADGSVVDLSDCVPQRAGYDFGGWYADQALTESVTSVTLDADKTVYAKWTEKKAESPAQTYTAQILNRVYRVVQQICSILTRIFR